MSASLHSATAIAAGSSQRRSQLLLLGDDVLVSHLLPLVSNHTFYVTMPQLCTVTRRLLSQSHLHAQQAQRRLSLSDVLWSEMRRRDWRMAADDWDREDHSDFDEGQTDKDDDEELDYE